LKVKSRYQKEEDFCGEYRRDLGGIHIQREG
jgi:hypothetical protein